MTSFFSENVRDFTLDFSFIEKTETYMISVLCGGARHVIYRTGDYTLALDVLNNWHMFLYSNDNARVLSTLEDIDNINAD